MSFDKNQLSHKIEASRNPTKEYSEFKNRYKKALIVWILSLILGFLLILFFDTNTNFINKFGWVLFGTGAISLLLSLILAIAMVNKTEPNPLVTRSGNILNYYLEQLIFGENYYLIFLLTVAGFTFISAVVSIYIIFGTNFIV